MKAISILVMLDKQKLNVWKAYNNNLFKITNSKLDKVFRLILKSMLQQMEFNLQNV